MIKFFIEPGYDVKHPIREFGNSGVDMFIPNLTEKFKKAFEEKNKDGAELFQDSEGNWCIRIKPHGDANIPSGLRGRISPNICLQAQNKSGVSIKYKLVYGAALIDQNYQGIIHMHLIETAGKEVILQLGNKVLQFVPCLVDLSTIEVVTDGNLDKFYENFEFSNRGDGAFGSTGTK